MERLFPGEGLGKRNLGLEEYVGFQKAESFSIRIPGGQMQGVWILLCM